MIGFSSLSRPSLSSAGNKLLSCSIYNCNPKNVLTSFPKKLFTTHAKVLRMKNLNSMTNVVKRVFSPTRHAHRSFSAPASTPPKQSFLQYWVSHKTIPERCTLAWVGEMALIFTVFGMTGSSTMFLVRPVISNMIQLEGTMKDGKEGEIIRYSNR